ncbi:MAG: glycosyltransferase family 2 protein [Victivallales bacterium]|nr:glycosyltransferase family 2 protein [Victivallales bacterium]
MTSEKHPFFSIIVPCCDVEPYVRESLDSVLNQPFQDWECIIGVETSKDKTEEIVREYQARDSRFRIFTAPRSGSCSASRNTGIDMATGEYIIFLDGDDTITDGTLQRLHDKISERPDADLYPCAMLVHNDMTGQDEPIRDNYPTDFNGELTGQEALLMIYKRFRDPCPMLQLTVFKRQHLVANNLKCLYGLKRQDSEFAPRALYLAKRVIPLHEALYLYRIRSNSVSTNANNTGYFLKDYAGILKSLLKFHANVSRDEGFDRRISSFWARHWLTWVYYFWFAPRVIKNTPRQRRIETLESVFKDGFDDFDALSRAASRARRIAGGFVKLFVRHPNLAWLVDVFFAYIYYPLVGIRDSINKTE